MTASKAPRTAAWMFADYEDADAAAMQALMRGEADPAQQGRALKWIIESACGYYDLSFRPGGEEGRRDTDFAEGRRFVGASIVKLTKVKVSKRRTQDGPNQ